MTSVNELVRLQNKLVVAFETSDHDALYRFTKSGHGKLYNVIYEAAEESDHHLMNLGQIQDRYGTEVAEALADLG